MRKKKWSAGFSMVELLLAVAILAALCGFGFVSVAQQRKNLAIMEANETAKEIFLAAQEHLSMAALQGRLHPAKQSNLLGLSIQGMGEDALGVKVKDSDSYAIFDEKSAPDDDGPSADTLSYSASEVMLPKGSVDDFVLNHRYAVRYNADAYRTLEVFYTQNDYRFEGALWTDIQTWVEGRKQVQENPGSFRVKNEKPVIMGWYGET
ncbi:MAG: prepilin-type N-terminal cleavage/methylation domain-containing protein, partial [Oscillospiraceae bacterium]|nr:prepilin-type N-terminal cleavage/methylation domain-containing protein [Oscillospiraceae bacterium]